MKIRLEDLAIGYDKPIVENINIEFDSGNIYGIVGLNGCGKSTLLRTISAIIPALNGRIIIDDMDINRLSKLELSRKMSLVVPEYFDLSSFTVYDIVAFGRYPYKNFLLKFNHLDDEIINNALLELELIDLKYRKTANISQGELQRTLIARAFVQQTPVILLDEPLSHLDPQHQFDIMKILHNKAKRENKLIIIISHQIKFLTIFSDFIVYFLDNTVKMDKIERFLYNNLYNNVFSLNEIYFDRYSLDFDIFPYKSKKKILFIGGDNDIIIFFRYFLRNGYTPYCYNIEKNLIYYYAKKWNILINKKLEEINLNEYEYIFIDENVKSKIYIDESEFGLDYKNIIYYKNFEDLLYIDI